MKVLDFIEIGACDFNTEIEKMNNRTGITIEPLKFYLDNLPDNKYVKKMNLAISNYDGIINVFYVDPKDIIKYNLPKYISGCNSVGDYHSTTKAMLEKMKLDINKVIKKHEIPCLTFQTLLSSEKIEFVYLLKIDTEGHDCVILKNYYDYLNKNNSKILPQKIFFETNRLTNSEDVDKTITLYNSIGYDLITRGNSDSILQLNLKKIKNKNVFKGELKNYYIEKYPENYNISELPHGNDLKSAQEYCIKNNCSGVTYQNGFYTVRVGKYLLVDSSKSTKSWLFM